MLLLVLAMMLGKRASSRVVPLHHSRMLYARAMSA
jgi:hypothetical protein